jgi:chaperonin GroES
MKIQPVGQRVLLKPVETKDQTEGGIYIPEEAKEDKKEGYVEAVGTLENGEDIPLKKGTRVLYGGYSNEEFERNGQEYVIIKYKDVLATLEE